MGWEREVVGIVSETPRNVIFRKGQRKGLHLSNNNDLWEFQPHPIAGSELVTQFL